MTEAMHVNSKCGLPQFTRNILGQPKTVLPVSVYRHLVSSIGKNSGTLWLKHGLIHITGYNRGLFH